MAAKTVSSGKTSFGWRILLFIAGIALILLCLKGVALTFFGAEATAEITKVDVKTHETDSDDKRKISETKTVVTQYYKFTVDGKEYTGSHQTSKKNRVGSVIRVDQAFIDEKEAQKSIKVKYMKFWPGLNSAGEAAKPGLGTALYGLGGLLGLFLLVMAFKRNKKKNAPAAQQTGVGMIPPQTAPPASAASSVPSTEPKAAEKVRPTLCPYCGELTDGPFCPGCGAKLGE